MLRRSISRANVLEGPSRSCTISEVPELCAVSQAATGASLDPRAGQVDPVSHERSSTCVQEGKTDGVALEIANPIYFMCIIVTYPRVHY